MFIRNSFTEIDDDKICFFFACIYFDNDVYDDDGDENLNNGNAKSIKFFFLVNALHRIILKI